MFWVPASYDPLVPVMPLPYFDWQPLFCGLKACGLV
jgi:hypothetical protein